MRRVQRAFLLAVVATIAAALLLTALSGCGSKSDTATTKPGPTALGSLAAARSALSTTAPDAKLLVVQTAQAVPATGTPVWAYIFGSPKTGKTYLVYTTGGQAMGSQEYGDSGLSADEWGKVPSSDEWKIDSDAAFKKAVAASGAKGDPAAYMMGFTTYKPATDTSTVEPFVWNVYFDPGESGATTATILVNAKTGDTKVSKD
jgi:hypothetical protein